MIWKNSLEIVFEILNGRLYGISMRSEGDSLRGFSQRSRPETEELKTESWNFKV